MADGTAGPGPRGTLSPVTASSHFPASFTALEKKTLPQMVIYNGNNIAVGVETFTEPVEVGQCEGFTVYATGTGDWNIQFSPNPNHNESFWVDAAASNKSGDGYLATTSRHPWIRVVVRSGANLIVWIYRKYATY